MNGKEDELASDGGDSDDLDGEVVAPVVSKKGKGKGKEKGTDARGHYYRLLSS